MIDKPNKKPANPNFSSGPTAKRPGWSIINLQSSLVSRSHRSIECKKKLKAGVAKDNNSRIQTVKKTDNLHYYNLIKNFDSLTKIPVLINTSLNLPGEVLVETMQDLKELFERSKLKFIYLPEINKLIKK